jgi:DNA polymerase III epsilon subunit-like protein
MSETLFAAVPFVVVDVETTGGSAHTGDRVTEVAAVSVQGTEVRDVFHSLVNPQRPIPPFITRLTGISDSMVRSAPVFRDIAGDLAVELAGRVFVAHNARFDWSFLNAEFGRVANGGLDAITDTQLCTVRLARRMLAHLPQSRCGCESLRRDDRRPAPRRRRRPRDGARARWLVEGRRASGAVHVGIAATVDGAWYRRCGEEEAHRDAAWH